MTLKPMTPEQLFESLLVATQADQAGGGNDSDARRDRWLRQFIFAFANDEANEGTSFQGTIPQALMMMNGDLMTEATSVQARQLPRATCSTRPKRRGRLGRATSSTASTWPP